MAEPPYLQPFVLPYEPVEPVAVGDDLDLYRPSAVPAPAVVLVHGGPVPAATPRRPRTWSAFRGYGSLLARAGVVGAVLEHGYQAPGDLDRAAGDVRRLVEVVRADPAVDGDRVALWFFSGGGVLAGEWLADPPEWLAAVALTYPLLVHRPDAPSALVTPAAAVATGTRPVPLLLTRVELEIEPLVPGQRDFLAAAAGAGVPVEVLEVPGARHGFETLDDTDAARAAIRTAVDRIVTLLR